ncbi:MAG: thioredoxin domain-containing protein [Deltaproteobacteria bacterium]|nr:thioredoxin domain-containing protein [Deltaproteobacteria bacterium]MBW2724231.1 thioredoxin domain-containing protein [Deltaproteobacteria bacterium]
MPKAMPGAPPLSDDVRRILAERLSTMGAEYVPRTRNLTAEGAPLFTNRLLLESSPYLQQHAHNPVNWYPWGDEAFATAKRLGRPLLVSIGYSTCHWCHVMEEESFDDPELAAYLNANFIAIKIDREVRPDIDAIYMAAVHAMGVRGGWPLNVFVTPDRKPFYGGTYFPPTPRGGRQSFRQVLESIAGEYAANREGFERQADQIAAHIRKNLEGQAGTTSQAIPKEVIEQVVEYYIENSDPTWGGLNRAPKFPSSLPVRLLLRFANRTGDPRPVDVASLALQKMSAGGIHDHLGGGFHRYSTDSQWLVPHFEKMLYDNALLAQDYLEVWQKTGQESFAEVCRKTLRYVAKEMTAPGGAFYSATDADSKNPSGETEEGYFFSWTPDEITQAVGGDRAKEIEAYYGVSAKGNFEGRNIFRTWRGDREVAAELAIPIDVMHRNLAASRAKLYEIRSQREAPLLDDKILVAWNGLMVSAFARAGFAFEDPDLVARATRAAQFVLDNMRRESRLIRVFKGTTASGPAFLEDYAFFIKALLDLYEASFEPRWLREAIALQSVLDEHYLDTKGGGYFKTADDGERLLAREKPGHDGAIPSGNSIAALNLLRLHLYTTDARYLETAEMLFSAFDRSLRHGGTAVSELFIAVDYQLDTPKEIIIVSPGRGPELDAMLAPLRKTFLPNRTLSVVIEGEDLEAHAALSPLVAGKRARGGRVTAYVCENRVCKYPTESPAKFSKQIAKVNLYP